MTRYEYVKTVLEPRFKDEDELYHHGILGMKWGIRRFQNADGSLTPEGRKRYYGPDGKLNDEGRQATRDELMSLYKIGTSRFTSDNAYQRFSVVARQMFDERIDDDVKEGINNKRRAYYDAALEAYELESKKYNDYEHSEQAKKDSQKAYKQTIDWYKKYEPEEFESLVKINGGSEDGLDDYHDFRKMYEGYHSEASEEGRAKWEKEKHKAYNISEEDQKRIDAAYEKTHRLQMEYQRSKEQAITDMLGVDENDKKYKNLRDGIYFSVNI